MTTERVLPAVLMEQLSGRMKLPSELMKWNISNYS